MNREIAARLIRHIGYDVDRAEDGEQACDILEHGRMFYDAVLMDIRMPVLDGYAATRQIRKSRDPAVRSVPIIAMTADAFDEDIEKAREAGMNAFRTTGRVKTQRKRRTACGMKAKRKGQTAVRAEGRKEMDRS